MEETILFMNEICKSFSGVKVLTNVNFQLNRGEIHALLGENGAGKTTLMRILAAEIQSDKGEIILKDRKVNFLAPGDAKRSGISFVHQELALIPTLSIAENLFLGRLPCKKGLVDWRKLFKESRQLLSQLNVNFPVETPIRLLSMGERQIVEIAKALSLQAEIFIMDEPTASLSADESQRLFKLMGSLAKQGKSFIYISHRLQEVSAIAHRVTILRDGQIIKTVASKDVTLSDLGELIIGRKIDETKLVKIDHPNTPIVLEAKEIVANKVDKVSFEIHVGEIVGLYGLVGAGRTELARAILGLDQREAGDVKFLGKMLPKSFRAVIKRGIGFLPEDRKSQALFQGLSVNHNITVTKPVRIAPHGIIKGKLERNIVYKYIKDLNIKAFFESTLRNLSGGTQQKISLSKWLYANSQILILDEPTKGIDVSARFEIYQVLEDLAAQGLPILLISSDPQEIIRLSNRVLIMRLGKIVVEIGSKNITEELLLSYALGTNDAAS